MASKAESTNITSLFSPGTRGHESKDKYLKQGPVGQPHVQDVDNKE